MPNCHKVLLIHSCYEAALLRYLLFTFHECGNELLRSKLSYHSLKYKLMFLTHYFIFSSLIYISYVTNYILSGILFANRIFKVDRVFCGVRVFFLILTLWETWLGKHERTNLWFLIDSVSYLLVKVLYITVALRKCGNNYVRRYLFYLVTWSVT